MNSIKILGVTVDSDASFKTHVKNIAAKMRARAWALSRLRKKGLPEDKLVKAYKCLIRPTVKYASPSWHPMLTATQAALLEKQQSQALKNIYGVGISANKMRIKAGIETLASRREKAAVKFAKKNLTNPRCQEWFPQ